MVSQRVENTVIRLLGTRSMIERLALWEKQERGGLPSFVEMLIIWYVAAFVWAEVKQLWTAGVRDYATDMWNLVDFMTNSLYICWICLRLVLQVKTKILLLVLYLIL